MHLRPKRLPHGGVPRAKIARTTAPISDDVDIGTLKPQCLLYVRNYCDFHRTKWRQCLKHTQLKVLETIRIGEDDEHGHCKTLVCRVMGMPDQMESAVMYPCVERWEYVTTARVSQGEKCDEGGIPYVLKVTAQGGGPIKVRPKPKGTMEASLHTRKPGAFADDTGTYPTTIAKPDNWVSGVDEHANMTAAQKDSDNTSFPRTKF